MRETGRNRIATLLERMKKAQGPEELKAARDALLKAWIATGPVSAQALLKQAERAQADGLGKVAERQLELVVKRWPDYEEGRLRRAFYLWQRGRDEAALRELETILRRNPDYFPALVLKVRISLANERLKDAVQACRLLSERFPHWREMKDRCRRLRLRLEREA